jgi:hypothetical protein
VHETFYFCYVSQCPCVHRFLKTRLVDENKVLFQYYGPFLGHPLPHIRQLAVSCFVLIPKKLSSKVYLGHIKRLMKAVASHFYLKDESTKTVKRDDIELQLLSRSPASLESQEWKRRAEQDEDFAMENTVVRAEMNDAVWELPKHLQDVVDGVTSLYSESCAGIRGCLHSSGGEKVSELLSLLLPLTPLQNEVFNGSAATEMKAGTAGKKPQTATAAGDDGIPTIEQLVKQELTSDSYTDTAKTVVTEWIVVHSIRKLFRHMHPSESLEFWLRILSAAETLSNCWKSLVSLSSSNFNKEIGVVNLMTRCLISSSYLIELLIFGVRHSNGRALADGSVRSSLKKPLISTISHLVNKCLSFTSDSFPTSFQSVPSARREALIQRLNCVKSRSSVLFSELWLQFPVEKIMLSHADSVLPLILEQCEFNTAMQLLSDKLLPVLPSTVVQSKLIGPVITCIATRNKDSTTGNAQWLSCLIGIFYTIADDRLDLFSTSTEIVSTNLLEGSAVQAAEASSAMPIDRSAYDKTAMPEDDWDENPIEENDEELGEGSDSEDSENDHTHKKRKRLNRYPNFKARQVKSDMSMHIQVDEDRTQVLAQCSNDLWGLAARCSDIIVAHVNAKLTKRPKSSSGGSSIHSDDDNSSDVIMSMKCLNWLICIAADYTFADASSVHASISKLLSALHSTFHSDGPVSRLKNPDEGYSFELHAVRLLCGAATNPHLRNIKIVVSKKSLDIGEVCVACLLHMARLMTTLESVTMSTLLAFESVLTIVANDNSQHADLSVEMLALVRYVSAEDISKIFASLYLSLQSPSHWIRLLALRLLQHVPLLRADVKLTVSDSGFYEIARTNRAPHSSKNKSKEEDSSQELNSIVFICLKLALLPASLRTEREFVRLLGRLEVTMRLREVDANIVRVVGSFCIGLLHIKFLPIWDAAVGVLGTCASSNRISTSSGNVSGEELVWELLAHSVEPMSRETLISGTASDSAGTASTTTETVQLLSTVRVDQGRIQVPLSVAKSHAFCVCNIAGFVEESAVDPDARTDGHIAYASMWSVLKKCPGITVRKSKAVVPYFLR